MLNGTHNESWQKVADEYIKEMTIFMEKCNDNDIDNNTFSLNDEEETLIHKKDN
jgi:CTP:phosphocholine cytidylyltransferase-like protein